MEAIEMLKRYKKIIDPCLKRYFKEKIKKLGKSDFLAKQAIGIIADFTLSDGKRIRPALIYYGYLASGGHEEEKIIKASMSLELVHSFLLIHDDIIDRDEKRHGVSTVHERYKKLGRKIISEEESSHFGNSMAIIVGDMAHTMANEIIFNSDFPAEVIIEALDKLQKIVYTTCAGEMLDVFLENRGRASEEEVLKMFEEKTSRYTFEGPLQFGAVLSGNGEKMQKIFSAYSLPLGKAFQIRDDILGIFGTEKKIGKPVGSDIIEGKQTLLLVKALEKSDAKQKEIIKKCFRKKDLTKKELEEFRQVVKETGALAYCQDLSEKLVKEALLAIKDIKFKNKEAKKFLEGIAEYIVKREV